MGEEDDGPVPHLAWRIAAGQPPPLRRFAGEDNGLVPHPAWRVRRSASSPPQIRLVCFNFVRGRDTPCSAASFRAAAAAASSREQPAAA